MAAIRYHPAALKPHQPWSPHLIWMERMTMSNTTKEATPGSATEENKVEKAKENKSSDEEKDDPKKRRGWPSRAPFHNSSRENRSTENPDEKKIYWSELTWNQKIAWRKAFLREYLSETKKVSTACTEIVFDDLSY